MKFFLVISFCTVCITSSAQKKLYASLQLVYPGELTYDTLLIKDSEGKMVSEKSKLTSGEKTVNTYLINVGSITEGSFSIYFGGSSSKVNDTLFFLSSGKKLLIEIEDSFALRNHINFKLRNVYNFDELYKRYNQYLSFQTRKYDSVIKRNPNHKLSQHQYFLKAGFDFVKKNVGNPYSIDLFSVFIINHSNVKYDEAYQFYTKNLKDNIHDPKTRKFVEDKIEKLKQSLDEGNKAPAFSARSIDHKLINSDSLLGKNVLLIFWATWCVPCMQEIPYLKEIKKEYKGDNLVIISVSLDSDSTKMANVVSEKKLNWVHIFNNRPMIESFRINPIPAIFLIDEKGVIIYNSINSGNGLDNLERLKFLLNQKFKH